MALPREACPVRVSVQAEDFDLAAEYAALRQGLGDRVGAVAHFVGLVRGEGSSVESLTLEHYPGMTERSIERIAEQAAGRWPLDDIRVVHRVGTLPIGAQIVFVQVASRHRDAAFSACRMIMDYLKTDAVFWKREAGSAGERWVQSTDEDRQRQAAWQDAWSDRDDSQG